MFASASPDESSNRQDNHNHEEDPANHSKDNYSRYSGSSGTTSLLNWWLLSNFNREVHSNFGRIGPITRSGSGTDLSDAKKIILVTSKHDFDIL